MPHRSLQPASSLATCDLVSHDNRPVNAEELMHREVTESPDLPPGHVRITVSQGVRKSAGDLSQQKQPVQDRAPPQPVPVPLPAAPQPTDDDRHWMSVAVEQAQLCPPPEGAFSVGAVILGQNGQEISRGYSREGDPHYHAEEAALKKLEHGDPRLATATIYSTLEPCSERKSSPVTCTQLILDAGIPRVVVAWREPATSAPQERVVSQVLGDVLAVTGQRR